MEAFFQTKLDDVKFENDDSFVLNFQTLQWTRESLAYIYWRACYSYILCSVIGAFESAFDRRRQAQRAKHAKIQGFSMVLTGVQGTGKSVLGSFIALVMAKVFNWCVTYQWGNQKHTTPKNLKHPEKCIAIRDLSTGGSSSDDAIFELLVSSCNKDRWHYQAQQETWTTGKGNMLFINTAPPDEIDRISRRWGSDHSEATQNFEKAGGVTRLCLESHKDVKARIDTAFKEFDLTDAVKQISQLLDKTHSNSAKKTYPGLLVHAVPIDPFRNQWTLRPSSKYVALRIASLVEKSRESEIHKLLKSLIEIPKARGFAGWIWEPLFTKKMKLHCTLCINGAELPIAKATSLRRLYEGQIETTDVFETYDDFVRKCLNWISKGSKFGKASRSMIVKAKNDNFTAIDAILVLLRTENGQQQITVAGLQMTVAQTKHELKEKGLDDFSVAVETIKKVHGNQVSSVTKEIWFLQPQEYIDTFGFVKLQPIKFEQPRFPAPQDLGTSRSGRKRRKTENFATIVTEPGKKTSNYPNYWPPHMRDTKQFVAIVSFTHDDSPAGETPCHLQMMEEDYTTSCYNDDTFETQEPTLRTWESTMAAFAKLKEGNILDSALVTVIEEDLRAEGQQLGKID